MIEMRRVDGDGRRSPGFVDIHSHVLYGLDDGPETVEQSVAMLELAREAGTTDIVATPHADGTYHFQPDLIEARIAELSVRVPGINIHTGCDFHLQADNIDDAVAHPDRYTINHRGFLLVEFPHVMVFHGSDDTLGRLLDAGMTPIVTHPERNNAMQQFPDVLARWVERGCFIQVTAASCTGLFGKRVKAAADDLLERNLVHVIASDAHDVERRSPDLRPAYERVAKEWGDERARLLFVENPKAALAGQPMGLPDPAGAPPARNRWMFWR